MRLRSRFLFLVVSLSFRACWAQTELIPVVPLPKEIQRTEGNFELPRDRSSVRLMGLQSTRIHGAVDRLWSEVVSSLRRANSSGGSTGRVEIGLVGEGRPFNESLKKHGVDLDEKAGEEAYAVVINDTGILLGATHERGLFYGIQTLIQLIRSSSQGRLDAMTIRDWPDFLRRIIQDDISRGPVPNIEFLREQIRRCAELKFNGVTYYTEHVVATRKHRAFAPSNGSISIDQWEELDAFARDHFVELIGNFQSFGHFEKILSHPAYEHLGEADRMLSPALPESYELLADIYQEMALAFTSDMFIVNCDEVFDLGRGYSKPLVDSLGAGSVYARHMQWIRDDLKKHGKRTMMWADVALADSLVLSALPRDMILMPWEYSPKPSFDDMITPLLRAGYDAIVAPGVLNSHRIFPDYRMARRNIRGFLSDALRLGVHSMILTTWDDGGGAFFSNDWYGVAYAADQSWHCDSLADRSFDKRFPRAVYGDSTSAISRAVMMLNELAGLSESSGMNEKVFWKASIPRRGERLGIAMGEWDEILDVCRRVRQCLIKARPVVRQKDLRSLRLATSMFEYSAQWRISLANASDRYGKAVRRQVVARSEASVHLLEAEASLRSLEDSLDSMVAAYRILWNMENQPYWLDRILDQFGEKKAQLKDVRRLVGETRKEFEKGQVLPPPIDVRLGIRKELGGYFRGWMVCGPFPVGLRGPEEDFLESMGGELAARPTVWVEVETKSGRRLRWHNVTAEHNSEFSFTPLFQPNTVVVAYAYCRIDSESDKVVQATYGSNDGIDIILNGRKIVSQRAKRSLIPDEDTVLLHLQKGRNHLLLKVDQNKGEWGFSFRTPDINVRGVDYRYRIGDAYDRP